MSLSVELSDVLGAAAVLSFVYLVRTLLVSTVRWCIRLRRRRKRSSTAKSPSSSSNISATHFANNDAAGGGNAGNVQGLPANSLVFDAATAKASAVVSGAFILDELTSRAQEGSAVYERRRGLALAALSSFFVIFILSVDLGFVLAESDRLVVRVKTEAPKRLDFVPTANSEFKLNISQQTSTIAPLSTWCYRAARDPYEQHDRTGGFNSLCIEPASTAEDLAKLNTSFTEQNSFGMGFAGGFRDGDRQRFIVQTMSDDGEVRRILDMFPSAQIATLDNTTLGYTLFPSLLSDLEQAHRIFNSIGETWHQLVEEEARTSCVAEEKPLGEIRKVNDDELAKQQKTGENNVLWSGMVFLTCDKNVTLAAIARAFISASFAHVSFVETRMILNEQSRARNGGVHRKALYAEDVESGLPIWLSSCFIALGFIVAVVEFVIDRRYASTEQIAVLAAARGSVTSCPGTDWRFLPAEKTVISPVVVPVT